MLMMDAKNYRTTCRNYIKLGNQFVNYGEINLLLNQLIIYTRSTTYDFMKGGHGKTYLII